MPSQFNDETHFRGRASGWSVYYQPLGHRWQWSVYGPAGGEVGSAANKLDAEMHAKDAWERATALGRKQ